MNGKRWLCLLLAAVLVLSLAACGSAKTPAPTASPAPTPEPTAEPTPEPTAEPTPEPTEEPTEAEQPEDMSGEAAESTESVEEPAEPAEAGGWPRTGSFVDADMNLLYVIRMDEAEDGGWYVGYMPGEDSWGGVLAQDGESLHGVLTSDSGQAEISVTVTEEEGAVLLAVEGGETCRFEPMELEEATIFVSVSIEGRGMIEYAEGEEPPEIDPERPFQSAQINLAESAAYTLAAAPEAGSFFVKWTKNGEDYSTEPVITVLLDESADFVAVFEADPDWQNPIMNFIGEYRCGNLHAMVMSFGDEEAWININRAESDTEYVCWDIFGRLDTQTLSITYADGAKRIAVYDENGDIVSDEPVYSDGTGTVVFQEYGSFTWHEDASETGEDLVFEWVPVELGPDYSDADNWAYYGLGEEREADLFLICPTVDMNDESNMSLDDEETRASFLGALNMERGIYSDSARLFAPYYRQAAMKVYGLEREEREEALSLAYSDVASAFAWYLENENEGRPIILAGFSQGADMCYRLLADFFGDEELYGQLVAVYAIGWPCTEELTESFPQIRPARGADDFGVVVSFDCEAPELAETFINPADQRAYAINPLNWMTDETPADKSENPGACFTRYSGEIRSEIPALCGGYLDTARGVMKVTDISPADYPAIVPGLPEGAYHVYDYQFFFRSLQQNVAVRLEAYLAANARENAA